MTEYVEIPRHGPGPRPLPENLKTTVRVVGQQQVDEFEALCHLLRRRPHELAADMVRDAVLAYRADPRVGPSVQALVTSRRMHRAGLRVVEGGAQ